MVANSMEYLLRTSAGLALGEPAHRVLIDGCVIGDLDADPELHPIFRDLAQPAAWQQFAQDPLRALTALGHCAESVEESLAILVDAGLAVSYRGRHVPDLIARLACWTSNVDQVLARGRPGHHL